MTPNLSSPIWIDLTDPSEDALLRALPSDLHPIADGRLRLTRSYHDQVFPRNEVAPEFQGVVDLVDTPHRPRSRQQRAHCPCLSVSDYSPSLTRTPVQTQAEPRT